MSAAFRRLFAFLLISTLLRCWSTQIKGCVFPVWTNKSLLCILVMQFSSKVGPRAVNRTCALSFYANSEISAQVRTSRNGSDISRRNAHSAADVRYRQQPRFHSASRCKESATRDQIQEIVWSYLGVGQPREQRSVHTQPACSLF